MLPEIDGFIVLMTLMFDSLNQSLFVKLTRFALGKQSKMLNINFAFPSGSSGKQTPANNILLTKVIIFLENAKLIYLKHQLSFEINIL